MATKQRELGKTRIDTIWIILNAIYLKKQTNVMRIFRTTHLSYETILRVITNLKQKGVITMSQKNRKIIEYSLNKNGEEILTILSKLLEEK